MDLSKKTEISSHHAQEDRHHQIIEACKTGNYDILQHLLSSGIDRTEDTWLTYIILDNQQFHLLELLGKFDIQTQNPEEKLLHAILRNGENIKQILSSLADDATHGIDILKIIPSLIHCGIQGKHDLIEAILQPAIADKILAGIGGQCINFNPISLGNFANYVAEYMNSMIKYKTADHLKCAKLLWNWIASEQVFSKIDYFGYPKAFMTTDNESFISYMIRPMLKKKELIPFLEELIIPFLNIEKDNQNHLHTDNPEIVIHKHIIREICKAFEYYYHLNDIEMIGKLVNLRLMPQYEYENFLHHKKNYITLCQQCCETGNKPLLVKLLQGNEPGSEMNFYRQLKQNLHPRLISGEKFYSTKKSTSNEAEAIFIQEKFSRNDFNGLTKIAVAYGHIEIYKYLEQFHIFEYDINTLRTAMRSGQPDIKNHINIYYYHLADLSNELGDNNFDNICRQLYHNKHITPTQFKILVIGSFLLDSQSKPLFKGQNEHKFSWYNREDSIKQPAISQIIAQAVRKLDTATFDLIELDYNNAKSLVTPSSGHLGWTIFGKMLNRLYQPIGTLSQTDIAQRLPGVVRELYLAIGQSNSLLNTNHILPSMINSIWGMREKITYWVNIYDSLTELIQHSLTTPMVPNPEQIQHMTLAFSTEISPPVWLMGYKLHIIKFYAQYQGSRSDHTELANAHLYTANCHYSQVNQETLDSILDNKVELPYNKRLDWIDAIWEMRCFIDDVPKTIKKLYKKTNMHSYIYNKNTTMFNNQILIKLESSINDDPSITQNKIWLKQGLYSVNTNTELDQQEPQEIKAKMYKNYISKLGDFARYLMQNNLSKQFFSEKILGFYITHEADLCIKCESWMSTYRTILFNLFNTRKLNINCINIILSYIIPLPTNPMYITPKRGKQSFISAEHLLEKVIDTQQLYFTCKNSNQVENKYINLPNNLDTHNMDTLTKQANSI